MRFDRSVEPVEVTASDPVLRLPMQRGIITSFEGMCMNEVKKEQRSGVTELRSNIVFDQKIQKSVEWQSSSAESAIMVQC